MKKFAVYPGGKVEELSSHQVNEAHYAEAGVKVVDALSPEEAKQKASDGKDLASQHEVKEDVMKDSVQQAAAQAAEASEEVEEPQASKKSRR